MTLYLFDQFVVASGPGSSAPGAVGEVFATADSAYTTPLPVFDTGGIPMANVTASADSIVQPFYVESDDPDVKWKSGPWVFPLLSTTGVIAIARDSRTAAQSAQLAAEQAANAAATAALAAQDAAAGVVNPDGGAGNGNILVLDWDGITPSTQPTRIYPSWHPDAGQTIPLPPEVVVRWRQPSFPLGVVVDGDEYRRRG